MLMEFMFRSKRVAFPLFLTVVFLNCAAFPTPEAKPADKAKPDAAPVLVGFTLKHNCGEDGKPQEGKTTDAAGWVVSDFSGKGKVRIEKDAAYL
jgi:hypothetical protein